MEHYNLKYGNSNKYICGRINRQNYNLTKCGETQKWDKRFTKTLYTWTPSIAVSAVQIYKGLEFPEWNNHILVTSLKDQTLRKLRFLAVGAIKA